MGSFRDWLLATSAGPTPPVGPVDHDTLVAFADQFVDQTLDRLRKADQPMWEHQAHVGRTLITLAGGGIIASVSVIQLVIGRNPEPHWIWLLPVSWGLWSLCILAALTREAWLSTARGTAARLERKRGEMRLRIRELNTANTLEDYERIITDLFEEAEKEPTQAVKVTDALGHVIYWTFAGGIVGMVIFAILNLPF